jgi:hypothetical protein
MTFWKSGQSFVYRDLIVGAGAAAPALALHVT